VLGTVSFRSKWRCAPCKHAGRALPDNGVDKADECLFGGPAMAETAGPDGLQRMLFTPPFVGSQL